MTDFTTVKEKIAIQRALQYLKSPLTTLNLSGKSVAPTTYKDYLFPLTDYKLCAKNVMVKKPEQNEKPSWPCKEV